MRRRAFIMLGGAAATWPLAARAQQAGSVRRIGVLKNTHETDPEARRELAAFVQELTRLGWIDGSNIRIDYRFGAGRSDRMAELAKELVALKPDVLLIRSTAAIKALLRETRTVPIVFVSVSDPIGEGFANSMARPGRNITGFTNVESSVASKWVELLRELSPSINHIKFIFNPSTAPDGGAYYARLVERATASFAIRSEAAPVHSPAEIERVIAATVQQPHGGLIVLPDPFIVTNRTLIIELARRERLPAIYPFRNMAVEGGLISYGANLVDQYHRSAAYVDRVLKGENAGDLPIQAPVRYELLVNLKTAKTMNLTISERFLLLADEVVE
jgi:putative ABC transport system substrate-binding protein